MKKARHSTVPAPRRTACVVLLATALLSACSVAPRWRSNEEPVARDPGRLFRAEGALGAPRDLYASETAEVPIRANLRPCCAFGAQLQVRVGPVPIPLYFLGNLVDRRKVRHHVYDAGIATIGSRGAGPEIVHSEGNGLVYSCHAGFIDIAHVRDYSDTALYTITSVARLLETGGTIPLPDEGATVRIALRPVDEETMLQHGRWQIAIPLGQWLAFQASVWHEIATWFGWSTFTLFPEKVSAFSPDDLYSNLVGVRVGAAVVSQRGARDEFAYNRNVDRWMKKMLGHITTVPVAAAEEAMQALDGHWWDSGQRVPEFSLLRRRSFDVGEVVRPWLVPPSLFGPLLRAACGPDPEPMAIENPSAMSGISFAEQATLEIEVDEDLAVQEPFASMGRRITQEDFPALLEFIREQNRLLFGPDADRPDVEKPGPERSPQG